MQLKSLLVDDLLKQHNHIYIGIFSNIFLRFVDNVWFVRRCVFSA